MLANVTKKKKGGNPTKKQGSRDAYPNLAGAVIRPYPELSAGRGRRDYLLQAGNGRTTQSISKYANMLLNPFHREMAERYPDETTVPTGVTHFIASDTNVSQGKDGTIKIVRQQLQKKSIWSDQLDFNVGTALTPNSLTGFDYGGQYTAYQNLAGVARTLSCGLKVQITGLPVSTFMASGRWYFLQLQEREMAFSAVNSPDDTIASIAFIGEAAAIACVNAGKGFTITSQELLASPGGIHIPFLPSGPQAMLMSDVNPNQGAGADPSWAGNNAPWAIGGPTPASVPVVGSYSSGMCLVAVSFGVQLDTVVTYTIAHHTEYVPISGAAGIVDLRCADSDMVVREGITKVTQRVSGALHGSTNVKQVSNILGEGISGRLNSSPMGRIADTASSAMQWIKALSPYVRDFITGFTESRGLFK